MTACHVVGRVILSMCVAALLTACSIGGNDPNPPVSPLAEGATIHAVLGPLAGSHVTVQGLNGLRIGEGRTIDFDPDRDSAARGSRSHLRNVNESRRVGIVDFTHLDLGDLDDANFVVVTTSGGADVDADDDGVITSSEGSMAAEIVGGVSGVVRVSAMKEGTLILGPLSSLGAAALVGSTDSVEIERRLTRLATFLLKTVSNGGDLNGDSLVDFADLYAFDASDHDFSGAIPTRRDEAAIATPALAKRLLPAPSDTSNVSARLSSGGPSNTPVAIAADLFGDRDQDGLADIFEDPQVQDVDGDRVPDASDVDIDGDGVPNMDEAALGATPWNPDMDGNGISDGDEDSDQDGIATKDELVPASGIPKTDPAKADTDDDTLHDKVEIDNGLDPANPADGPDADSDGDSIHNGAEIVNGLDPTGADDATGDLDGDTLTNAEEINRYKTDIRADDTDVDGLLDNEEAGAGFDPRDPSDGGTADADADGISNVLEVHNGLNPRDPTDASLDPDMDGLTNRQEVVDQGTDHAKGDTDGDGLGDRAEVVETTTDPTRADTDGDGRLDGAEVNDPLYPSDPKLVDTDGDGLSDRLEAEQSDADNVVRLHLFDNTPINTSPTKMDSDGDGLSDPLEVALQAQYARYGPVQSASDMLRGALHPNNVAAPAQLGGLRYLAPDAKTSVLEEDPDGDGKPTIEEIFHASDPSNGASEFLYVFEFNAAGVPNEQRRAMDMAGFVYVPGGWDVDSDGLVDQGFYVSKYEAKAATERLTEAADVRKGLSGTIVYSKNSQLFYDRLCHDSNPSDANGADSSGICRGNRYDIDDSDEIQSDPSLRRVKQVDFEPVGRPYTGLTWLEARLAVINSKIDGAGELGGPYNLELPSERQWMQMVGTAAATAENWSGGRVMEGALVRGHTDGSPASVLGVNNPRNEYAGTGNSSNNGADQRRTLILKNGSRARDFDVPLAFSVEVWDLSGNAAEWSLGLFAANADTSRPEGRDGGDRFANGKSGLWAFDTGLNLSGHSFAEGIDSMPEWWKPRVLDGEVLGTSRGGGAYYDGSPLSDVDGNGGSDGGLTDVDYGYGAGNHADGFVAILRGGAFDTGFAAGVSYADLQHGIGVRRATAGFRAVVSVAR